MGFRGMLFPEADPGWWKNEEGESEEIKLNVQETEAIKTSRNRLYTRIEQGVHLRGGVAHWGIDRLPPHPGNHGPLSFLYHTMLHHS